MKFEGAKGDQARDQCLVRGSRLKRAATVHLEVTIVQRAPPIRPDT